MKLLRTLSTPRLLVLLAALLVAATLGTAIAVASGGGGPKPAPKALAEAVHDALAAKPTEGISARIAFTNRLFPSSALTGDHVSPLIAGASGRLWIRNDGRGRLELQSDAGDAQIVWAPGRITVYDASSNTVYRATLPARKHQPAHHTRTAPSPTKIAEALAKLRRHASVSGAAPSDVAGRAAYTVVVGPKRDGGLLGSVQLAWDALRGVPLRFAVYAKGSSSPVLELTATDVSYGPVPLGDVDVAPAPHAKTVTLARPQVRHERQHAKLRVASAQPPFTIAPATLAGRARTDVRPLGSKSVLVVYGKGLDSLLVLERQVDETANHHGPLTNLPSVSLGDVTGHELATPLGTAVSWERAHIAFVLAGSVPKSTAEGAARALR